jgi:hypothetical protein
LIIYYFSPIRTRIDPTNRARTACAGNVRRHRTNPSSRVYPAALQHSASSGGGDPASLSEVFGIGDHDGLLEQVGWQDWQFRVMSWTRAQTATPFT